MGYVQDNLLPNEKILFSARIHPVVFLPFFVMLAVSFCFVIFALTTASQQTATTSLVSIVFLLPGCLFFLIAMASFLRAIIIMLTTEFSVTNQRIVAKSGFIQRHTVEMLLSKVETVSVNQSVVGRLLNFGTVTITGTGGSKESFKFVVNPISIRKKINHTLQKYTQNYPTP